MNGIQKQNSLLIKSKKISKNKLKLNKLKQKNEKYNFGGIISLQIFLGLSVHFHSNSINIFLIDNFSFGDFLFLMTLIVPLIFILYFFYRAMKFSNIINKHINKMPNEKILYEEYLLNLSKNSIENFNELKKMSKENPELINTLSQKHIHDILYYYKKKKSTISNSESIKSVGIVYNNENQEIIND